MLVVADTSPLHYLVLIEHPAILPALFERILIPCHFSHYVAGIFTH